MVDGTSHVAFLGDGTVQYSREGDVAWITLNRPERLNAVVPTLVDGLVEGLRRATADQVRVAVIRGAGRAFCAGYDLTGNQTPSDPAALQAQVDRIQDVTREIRRAPFPVVASIHGYAIGAGCELALACDLAIAARTTQLQLPEVEVGLSVTGGISYLLPLAVGLAKAKELILLGDRFDAVAARDMGLLGFVSEPEQLVADTTALAARLVERPRLALQLAKASLDGGAPGDLEHALAIELRSAMLTLNTNRPTP